MLNEGSSDPEPRLTEKLFEPFGKAGGVLLAVSGGPDSAALLVLATAWRERVEGLRLFAATVDHGLRGESRQEAETVASWCLRLNVPHAILPWMGPKPKSRVQERARDARYALLREHASQVGATVLLTAHHADDQAETVLLRLLRGSGIAGLAGMAARRDLGGGVILARPFLDIPKATLIDFCRRSGQPFLEDPSNRDERFARTRIRRRLALADAGFGSPRLLRLAQRAARADAALGQLYRDFRDQSANSKSDGSLLVARAQLETAPDEFLVRLICFETAQLTRTGGPRLEQAEIVALKMREALRRGETFKASLGGVLLRLNNVHLELTLEAPRRGGAMGRPGGAPANQDAAREGRSLVKGGQGA